MPSHRGKLILLPPNRVWRTYPGGRTLDELAGAPAPADSHWAEDWIASTTRAINPARGASSGVAATMGAKVQASPAPPFANLHENPGITSAGDRPPPPHRAESSGISQVRIGSSPTLHDLQQLLASDADYFLGSAHVQKFGAQPQLLVKFLDSGTRLHFQVHPTRAFAQRVLGAPSGKTEAYHVLAVREPADDDASGCIYVGFQRPPTPAQLRDYIVTQNIAAIEACFDRIVVRPGDTFIIPGGTPHALGAGIFMVEIQEPSDLVVRFEFERAGFVLPEASRFMNRDVDFGLSVFNFGPLTATDLETRVRCRPRRVRELGPGSWQDELIGRAQTDCFRVAKTRLGAPVVKDENSATIAIVTAGSVTAEVGGETHLLRTYDKVFLPAGLGSVKFTPQSTAELLECFPPDP